MHKSIKALMRKYATAGLASRGLAGGTPRVRGKVLWRYLETDGGKPPDNDVAQRCVLAGRFELHGVAEIAGNLEAEAFDRTWRHHGRFFGPG